MGVVTRCGKKCQRSEHLLSPLLLSPLLLSSLPSLASPSFPPPSLSLPSPPLPPLHLHPQKNVLQRPPQTVVGQIVQEDVGTILTPVKGSGFGVFGCGSYTTVLKSPGHATVWHSGLAFSRIGSVIFSPGSGGAKRDEAR